MDDTERSDEMKSEKVCLIYNERRQDRPMRTVELSASTGIQKTLAEDKLVSRVWIDNGLG